jgi:hypothetical protein
MNLSAFRSGISALAFLLPVAPVLAHPGHSLGDATPRHLLTSPDHLAVLALGGAALWLIGTLMRRPLPRRILQSVGVLGMLGAAVLATMRA